MIVPQKAVCCDKNTVLVSVYVEKPRRRSSSPIRRRDNQYNHLHHHRRFDHLRHGEKPSYQRGGGQGYDRKAELLLYSRHLREDARSRPVATTPARHDHRSSTACKPETITRIVSVRRKQPRTCFGDWNRVLVPSFVRSYLAGYKQRNNGTRKNKKHDSGSSTHDKMTATVKRLAVKQRGSSVTKLVSRLQKPRR